MSGDDCPNCGEHIGGYWCDEEVRLRQVEQQLAEAMVLEEIRHYELRQAVQEAERAVIEAARRVVAGRFAVSPQIELVSDLAAAEAALAAAEAALKEVKDEA